ncbi:UV-B-induced protein At3g17800, chloroplastic-like, partial [Cucurbita pepo subsp. pepo]|uniref:UV-B-induced protein At3g17800, chloroplastic-like n=1 Tax=Cucurbita pepo subsp. pepo TaxID=3664 RepID=UPI000C9D9F96
IVYLICIFGCNIRSSLCGTRYQFLLGFEIRLWHVCSFPPFHLCVTIRPPLHLGFRLRARLEVVMASVIRYPVGALARLNSTGGSEIYGNGLGFVRLPSLFHVPIRLCPRVSYSKLWNKKLQSRNCRSTTVKASIDAESSGSDDPIAPLQLESPIGQFLTQILVSHPHLVPAAVEQQLDQLKIDRDAEGNKEASGSGTDLVLYRRIAEVKANERKKVLEEILYALIVQKFMDANVPLISTITPLSSDVSGRVDTWSARDESLEHLHSPEAYEMIQNHLALILGNRVGDSTSVAQISKLRVGQVYAASVMYGYFLKRVDQRFQLEKTIKVLPNTLNSEEGVIQQVAGEDVRPNMGENSPPVSPHPEISSWPDHDGNGFGEFGRGIKASRLRNYVMSFDGETLQRYATIRSKEAVGIVEKHTEALFGRPEIALTAQGTIDPSKDEALKISIGCLKGLVLEAVTFGSFLWDVESYVDSRYHFVVG